MRELENRQKVRRWLYSKPVLIGMLVVALLIAKGTLSIWQKERESTLRVKELESKAQEAAMREEELTASLAGLNTEEGIEEEIRSKFDVTRGDEKLVVIVEPRASKEVEDSSDTPWYKRFWNAIMRK